MEADPGVDYQSTFDEMTDGSIARLDAAHGLAAVFPYLTKYKAAVGVARRYKIFGMRHTGGVKGIPIFNYFWNASAILAERHLVSKVPNKVELKRNGQSK